MFGILRETNATHEEVNCAFRCTERLCRPLLVGGGVQTSGLDIWLYRDLARKWSPGSLSMPLDWQVAP